MQAHPCFRIFKYDQIILGRTRQNNQSFMRNQTNPNGTRRATPVAYSFFSPHVEKIITLFTFSDTLSSKLFILSLFYLNILYLFFLYSSILFKYYIFYLFFIISLFSNKTHGEKSMLILIVYLCRELQQLFLYGELLQHLDFVESL